MKKRFLSAIVMIAILAGVFAFKLIPTYGVFVFDLMVGILTIFAGIEMSKLLDKMHISNCQMAVGLYPSLVFAGHTFFYIFNLATFWWFVIQAGILLASFLIIFGVYHINIGMITLEREKANLGRTKFALKVALGSLIAFAYPCLLISTFMFANRIDLLNSEAISAFSGNLSWIILCSSIFLAVVSDISAFFAGSLIGGTKLTKISPKKTVIGSVASLVFTTILMGGLFYIFNFIPVLRAGFSANTINVWFFMIYGFIGSAVCQAGDLFESYLKRKADVKDSGNLIAGHGGILDRIDSHIFAMPYTIAFFALMFLI